MIGLLAGHERSLVAGLVSLFLWLVFCDWFFVTGLFDWFV